MNTEISVMLVEDHVVLRKSLRRMLEDDPEIRVVAEAGNGADAVRLVEQFWPRVVVMDLAMPVLDGIRATKEILKLAPQTAILVLSLYADERDVKRAFAAGAQGYMLKNANDFDLNGAIKTITRGSRILPPPAPAHDRQRSHAANSQRQIRKESMK